MPQWQNWQRIWKDTATNCTWSFFSFPELFDDLTKKKNVVELLG
jgi:hypothetical protein